MPNEITHWSNIGDDSKPYHVAQTEKNYIVRDCKGTIMGYWPNRDLAVAWRDEMNNHVGEEGATWYSEDGRAKAEWEGETVTRYTRSESDGEWTMALRPLVQQMNRNIDNGSPWDKDILWGCLLYTSDAADE